MITVEEFREILDEVVAELPEEYFQELNGGVLLHETFKVHPESVGEELVTLGEYRREQGMGRYVVIYYGSFVNRFPGYSIERMKRRLRETVRHEFLHHLESLAGEKGLEIEDEIKLEKYRRRRKSD